MPVTFEGYPALVLSNDRIEVTVLTVGSSIVSMVMRDDAAKINPLWNPRRIAAGRPLQFGKSSGFGHFVCVDGFGPVSEEEQVAGLPKHGEARTAAYDILESSREGNTQVLTLGTKLPLVQEVFKRTMRLVDGENVIVIDSELDNLMAFDRPVNWAEHATIGPPYLERGKTVVDMPAARAITRLHASDDFLPHRLASLQEFKWPLAPGVDGSLIDLRAAGLSTSGDHTSCLMRRDQPTAFVTFLHPEKRLLCGCVFRPEEFPWVQNWEHYPGDGQLARGLEFSTQPFDVPRRETIDTHTFLGAPTWRWLPAKSVIRSRFLLFWTRTPDNFCRIDDVRIENGTLSIRDVSDRVLELPASIGL
jgi:hypothetical protein